MAAFEQAGTMERLRSIAILRDMQRKLQAGAASALGVSAGASPAEIRAAFMALTKQYHPAKFARLDDATVKLANEVFLSLRDAYEALRAAASGAPPTVGRRLGTDPGATDAAREPRRAASAEPAVTRPAAPAPPISSTPPAAASSSAPRATTPVSAPAAAARPVGGAAPPGLPRASVGAPAASPAVSPSGAGGTAPGAPRAAGGTILGQRATATVRADSSAGPGNGAGPGQGPDSSAASAASAASTASATAGRTSAATRLGVAPSSREPAAPLQIRFSSHGPAQSTSTTPAAPATSATPPSHRPRTTAAPAGLLPLLEKKRWAEARQAMQDRSAREPAERANLAWLAYVSACELIDQGLLPQARRELVRALAIEPSLEEAKVQLAAINGHGGPGVPGPAGPRRS